MEDYMQPFRIFGNLYFIGTYRASCHMVDTGDGLLLIDTGYPDTHTLLAENIQALGFDVQDLKYIVHTHGHYDHAGATKALVDMTGAKTYISAVDSDYVSGKRSFRWLSPKGVNLTGDLAFEPDGLLYDGDTITFGNTTISFVASPGHTAGTMSLFFDVEEDGKKYRAGMHGGVGLKSLSRAFLDLNQFPYSLRADYFRSMDRVRQEHVDIFLGNHTWNNDTKGKYEYMQQHGGPNLFIAPDEWAKFLDMKCAELEDLMHKEAKELFVNYAHRGASQYAPENTLCSFCFGLIQGANGIETDVRRTKDGRLVLFHDDTLDRVTNGSGCVEGYTYEQLLDFTVEGNGMTDKIMLFDDFLRLFGWRDITFAIEIKGKGIARETVDLLEQYNMQSKTVITSFSFDEIKAVKAYAPQYRVGYLVRKADEQVIHDMCSIGGEELCPEAESLTAELVDSLHHRGFTVRAWGVYNMDLMRHVYGCGADGMTVNFPDELTQYIQSQNSCKTA